MKELIVTGDSWTFGSEIIDPSLDPNIEEWALENTKYRESHIFPNLLAKKLNLNLIKNLSFPGASNDRIFRSIYNYLLKYYINDGKSLSDVFLIVQLSSFDRRDFYYKSQNEHMGNFKTVWPNWEHDYDDYNFNIFIDTYSKFIQSDVDNLYRYVSQVFDFQNFCKTYKIPYLVLQGFYHTNYMPDITKWYDLPYIDLYKSYNSDNFNNTIYYQGSSELEMWDEVDPIRFMNKKSKNHSLHYILKSYQANNPLDSVFLDMHPNELGHSIIANQLSEYIKKYNLLSFN